MTEDFEIINTIDLFCGAGGFSKGLENAGFDIIAGIDYNEKVKDTYEKNHRKAKFYQYDMVDGVIEEFNKGDFDFIIGSPPCQGFSDARGNRDEKTTFHKVRNSLPFRYIEWIEALKPEIALLENVSGMATKRIGSKLVLELIAEGFKEVGYNIRIGLLNSVFYGVPQERIRVFCLGYKKKYNKILNHYPFPLPEFIPTNFKKVKPRKRKLNSWKFEETEENFFPIEEQNIITVGDVIEDLPENPTKDGKVNYVENIDLNPYLEYLRRNTGNYVSLHYIYEKPKPNELEILKAIPEGKIYRSSRFGKSYIGVWELFPSEFQKNEYLILLFMCRFRTRNGFKTKEGKHTEGYMLESSFGTYNNMINLMLQNDIFNEKEAEFWRNIMNKKDLPSPQETLKNLYENKWLRIQELENGISYDINTKSGIRPLYLRLHRELPSRTLMTTSFKVRELVHPTINRPITFREGARIQSFPDDFEFYGTPKNIAMMIGNAVPPLLAQKLGQYYKIIMQNISSISNITDIEKNIKLKNKLLLEYV